MSINKRVNLFLGSVFIIALMMVVVPAYASGDDDCRRGHEQCGHNDDDGGDIDIDSHDRIDIDIEAEAEANAEANADANAESNAEASGTQNVSITSQRPGNSYIGGGNSTAGEQKVFAIGGGWLTGNASFRFDLTDKDARKLRIARDWRMWGFSDALVNKMQCSAKIVYKPFGSSKKCEDALAPAPVPAGILISEDEYASLTMAQVAKEEYEEHAEQVEYRQEQQTLLIEELQSEHAEDNAKIDALKATVTRALEERDKRDIKEEEQRVAIAKIYSKYEAQEEEPADE